MSRQLQVLWAGRHRRTDWDRLYERYRGRISRFVELTEVPVRVGGAGPDRHRLRAEGRVLLAAVPQGAWSVALDRGGKQRSSAELAIWLQRLLEDWPGPITFLVGSDLGLDDSVLSRVRERLSLGRMTLPHELARLVLYEQIYRAFCIEAGIKYHRDPL